MNFFKSIKYRYNIAKKQRYYKNLPTKKYEKEIRKIYETRTGKELNLKNPETYTEKIQYAKLNGDLEIKARLADKVKVREWVIQKIGDEYLIPLLGVWNNIAEMKISELPSQFVLKTNHGSGTNIIVKDKTKLNYIKTYIKLFEWMNTNFAYNGSFELHYKDIKPKILAEKYITDSNGELNDYKFLCFEGKVYYCWIDVGRFTEHYRNVYDLDWVLQPWSQHTYSNTPWNIEKPKNFEKMVHIAEKLSENFSHVRVDLYNVDGKIYFGEMTFTNGAGYELIYPEKYNEILGSYWILDNE